MESDTLLILHAQARHALAITRSGASADLPGVRRTMTGSDDDAPAARGAPLGGLARRSKALSELSLAQADR